MRNKRYFGTDGIRGMVGASNVNPEFVLKLGWAFGSVLNKMPSNGHRKKVLIGKDTRVSGYMLESALESGLSAAGIDVVLLGPMPTPAVAYLTQTLGAAAGIVISASHNLFEDNGIKFFSREGIKFDDEIEFAIEEKIDTPLHMVSASNLGKAKRSHDAPGRYIEFCKSTIPSMMRFGGLKIVVDCANGATYHVAPSVFSELGAEVISIGDRPDGFNINLGFGSTNPATLAERVLSEKADVGVALDGDGDRLIMVDEKGNVINGDQLIYVIAQDRHQRGLLQGGIVGTQMSNLGLEQAILAMGIPFERTKVGDRYVMERLKEKNWRIGGESSGHIVCLDKTTTGDGIIAALQVLAAMVKHQKSLNELVSGMAMYPQITNNIKTTVADALVKHQKTCELMKRVTSALGDKGRILLRSSGTEPLVRAMIEGEDSALVTQLSEEVRECLQALATALVENPKHA